jgi:hypothetical protein
MTGNKMQLVCFHYVMSEAFTAAKVDKIILDLQLYQYYQLT